MFNSVNAVLELIKSGRLRALAITADRRSPQLPDVPTFAESGYKELVTGSWYAVWAPAKTPEAVVSKLNAELVRIIHGLSGLPFTAIRPMCTVRLYMSLGLPHVRSQYHRAAPEPA